MTSPVLDHYRRRCRERPIVGSRGCERYDVETYLCDPIIIHRLLRSEFADGVGDVDLELGDLLAAGALTDVVEDVDKLLPAIDAEVGADFVFGELLDRCGCLGRYSD